MTEVSAAQEQRRAALAQAFAVMGARRLTEHEVGLLLSETEWWLSTHPGHDSGLHEGPEKAADLDMSYCPHCEALTRMQKVRARIEVGL